MAFTIDGNSFIAPGGYGRNAARNVQYVSNTAPQAVLQANIQITPPGPSRSLNDVFGYAEEDIRFFDTNHDGLLDHNELTQAFAGQQQVADTFLKVMDTNRDQRIDPAEQAAYLLFQDDSINQIAQTAQNMWAMNLMNPPQFNAFMQNLQGVTEGSTSAPDGTLTPAERGFAEFSVLTMPTMTQQVLGKFYQFLNLPEGYQAFKQQSEPPRPLSRIA